MTSIETYPPIRRFAATIRLARDRTAPYNQLSAKQELRNIVALLGPDTTEALIHAADAHEMSFREFAKRTGCSNAAAQIKIKKISGLLKTFYGEVEGTRV